MDPRSLIGPASVLGSPAPFGFILFFKVLGFTLHAVPMHLWYAGILLAVLMHWRGGDQAKRVATRLMSQMPVIVALGVNFGIVPLLFTQVAYYRVFYPATILMAWPWLSIIVLLTLAYYGVYIYAAGLRDGGARMSPARRAAGGVAAMLFIAIGFLFANGFSLMTNVAAWPRLLQATSMAGAPLGIALNTSDPTLWPRWLMMFSLAFTTTAAYIVVDSAFLAHREEEDYRRYAGGLALKVYTAGLMGFALMGSWYVFGTWSAEVRHMMFTGPRAVLTVLTAISPGLPWMLIFVLRNRPTAPLATALALAQFGVLALNAVSRQIVQNAELRPYLDLGAEPVRTQWSPLILFLAFFIAGLGVVAWMVRKALATRAEAAD